MTLSFIKTSADRLRWLSDKRAFYDSLGRVEPTAVKLLAEKIKYEVKRTTRAAGLSSEDAEELLNDAVVITISNIKKGKFPFSDYSPVAYAKGVLRKLIANRIRSKKPRQEELETVNLVSDFSPEKYMQDKERQSIVRKLLERLGEKCRQLITLKYFKHLRDAEVVEQSITPYSSVGSLKSKRSQCLKELEGLTREAGIKEVF